MKDMQESMIILQTSSDGVEREKAAAALMEQYAGLLWSVCQRRLQDLEDVKECVNSTFAEICLHPERYDAEKGSLKNYLCMVADRKAIDCYHRNARRQQAEEDYTKEHKSAERSHNASDINDSRFFTGNERAAEKLEEALAQLDPIDSQILRMKYYDGMTYQEIAGQLGLTVGTVKMRSLRSRKKLFKILIIVLILALLAACAVAVLRKYQYTQHGGINQEENVRIYEMISDPYAWEVDGIQFCVMDAVFRLDEVTLQGQVTVYVRANWPDDPNLGPTIELELACSDEFRNLANIPDGGPSMYTCISEYHNPQKDSLDYRIEGEVSMDWSVEQIGQTLLTLPLYRGDEFLTEIQLADSASIEYEGTNQRMELLDGVAWTLGPAVADGPFAVVSMSLSEEPEWKGERLFHQSRYGVRKDEEILCLIGEDDTVYPVSQIRYDRYMNEVEPINLNYDLYFAGVEAGHYRMHIPYLYYTRDWTTEEFVLTLPTEEGQYMNCDVTRLFPDGSGIRILGITKETVVKFALEEDPDTLELKRVEIACWKYTLKIERLLSGKPEFLMAHLTLLDGINLSNGVESEDTLSMVFVQGEEPAEITLCFAEPEYRVKHDVTLYVTVEQAPIR